MKSILSIIFIIAFICTFFSGCQELSDYYAATLAEDKCGEIIDYFDGIALYSGTGQYYGVRRWEKSLHIKLVGDYTEEDYSTIRNFVETLNDLNELPDIYFTEDITTFYDNTPNFYIYFVPLDEMASYEFLNNTGRVGSAELYGSPDIYNSYIGIASDVTSQEDRNNLILHYVTAGLGLMHDSDKYADSIFSGSKDIQKLSDMDYELIRLLYSDSVRLRMDKKQVDEAIKPLIIAKLLKERDFK